MESQMDLNQGTHMLSERQLYIYLMLSQPPQIN